jgi:hypothetical protein
MHGFAGTCTCNNRYSTLDHGDMLSSHAAVLGSTVILSCNVRLRVGANGVSARGKLAQHNAGTLPVNQRPGTTGRGQGHATTQ